MKKISCLLGLFIFITNLIWSAPRYWVGPLNGNWNNPANWSDAAGGAGGFSVPGQDDDIFFPDRALVNVDISPTVHSMEVSARNPLGTRTAPINFSLDKPVTLYTQIPCTFTILGNLKINPSCILKDSTAADVPFDFAFNAPTNATAEISGIWMFEGGGPVSGSNGPSMIAPPGTKVTVAGQHYFDPFYFAAIYCKENSRPPVSNASTLLFDFNSYYVLDRVMDPSIPNAYWSYDGKYTSYLEVILGATILLTGDMGSELKHLGKPEYCHFRVQLDSLSGDASLNLPDSTLLKGDMSVLNTNGHTITLLSQTGPFSRVHAQFGTETRYSHLDLVPKGKLTISGAGTKVALARGSSLTPGTSYRLQLMTDYVQQGGSFSLQDYDGQMGSSTLALRKNFLQTSGVFHTNSIQTDSSAKFVVEFNGPLEYYYQNGHYHYGQLITSNTGTIDNGRNMVTLRINNTLVQNVNPVFPEGLVLGAPLSVGKLDLVQNVIITKPDSILTVTSPDSQAVTVNPSGFSYINGPLQRATGSTSSYVFPVGKNPFVNSAKPPEVFYHYDPLEIKPVEATASVYKAEYFPKGHADSLQPLVDPLKGISRSKYWDISSVQGAAAIIKLFLRDTVAGAEASDGIVVAHLDAGRWVPEHGSVLVPGNLDSGSVVSKPLSTFGAFTLGYITPVGGALPIHLVNFEGRKENGGAELNWKVEDMVSRFEILRSTDGINFKSVGTVAGKLAQQSYSFFDPKLVAGTYYYRLRSIEIDGRSTLSKIIVILVGAGTFEIAYMSPTVVKGEATVYVNASRSGHLELIVRGMEGRVYKKITSEIPQGKSGIKLSLGELPGGVYLMSATMDGQTSVMRFIRE